MELIKTIIHFVLHIDEYLRVFVAQYGFLTYGILFVVIFCETGLVITPFLPGDSLLFAAGSLASIDSSGTLNPFLLFVVLSIAAIIGDTINYMIGAYLGTKVFDLHLPFLKKEYLDRTNAFYEKYGGKTIILARFVPIVRTFAPFVAGVGKMSYRHFITFNIIGGVAWVAIFIFLGYQFGALPFVQKNFEVVTIAIIFISIIPMIVEYIRNRRQAKNVAVKGEIGDAT